MHFENILNFLFQNSKFKMNNLKLIFIIELILLIHYKIFHNKVYGEKYD